MVIEYVNGLAQQQYAALRKQAILPPLRLLEDLQKLDKWVQAGWSKEPHPCMCGREDSFSECKVVNVVSQFVLISEQIQGECTFREFAIRVIGSRMFIVLNPFHVLWTPFRQDPWIRKMGVTLFERPSSTER